MYRESSGFGLGGFDIRWGLALGGREYPMFKDLVPKPINGMVKRPNLKHWVVGPSRWNTVLQGPLLHFDLGAFMSEEPWNAVTRTPRKAPRSYVWDIPTAKGPEFLQAPSEALQTLEAFTAQTAVDSAACVDSEASQTGIAETWKPSLERLPRTSRGDFRKQAHKRLEIPMVSMGRELSR